MNRSEGGTSSLRRITDLPDHVEGPIALDIPARLRRGALRRDQRRSVESGIANLKGIAERTGLDDWSALRILDYGCGVKFTQTLVQFDVPVGHYVGIDVHRGIIDHLSTAGLPGHFQFAAATFHNERYNPDGEPLTSESPLPTSIDAFDLITLQSVFTHFKPDDFLALLRVLRRYAENDARLFFTCLINDEMATSFRDAEPDRPLRLAEYTQAAVRQMVTAGAWELLSVHPPSQHMQTQFVCRPA